MISLYEFVFIIRYLDIRYSTIFADFLPNAAALRAINSLISCGVSLGKIHRDYNVIGHRQARATLCPGDAFYKYVMKLPNWTSHPTPEKPHTTTTDAPTQVPIGNVPINVNNNDKDITR